MIIEILRLGHRRERDKRVTTHCALVGRAFGARGMYYAGDPDEGLEQSVKKVNSNWGGDFFIKHVSEWRRFIEERKEQGWGIVHLTMYGVPLPEVQSRVTPLERVLAIVGAEKVPGEVYRAADFNVAIGNQPHSEVAALAIFLDRMLGSVEFNITFSDARIRVIPQERGKRVEVLGR